jgi:hypothetical protein
MPGESQSLPFLPTHIIQLRFHFAPHPRPLPGSCSTVMAYIQNRENLIGMLMCRSLHSSVAKYLERPFRVHADVDSDDSAVGRSSYRGLQALQATSYRLVSSPRPRPR